MEGEAHVRATVVEREDAALVDKDEDRPALGGNNTVSVALQLFEATDAYSGCGFDCHRVPPAYLLKKLLSLFFQP
jgi:hypothetical protein